MKTKKDQKKITEMIPREKIKMIEKKNEILKMSKEQIIDPNIKKNKEKTKILNLLIKSRTNLSPHPQNTKVNTEQSIMKDHRKTTIQKTIEKQKNNQNLMILMFSLKKKEKIKS